MKVAVYIQGYVLVNVPNFKNEVRAKSKASHIITQAMTGWNISRLTLSALATNKTHDFVRFNGGWVMQPKGEL